MVEEITGAKPPRIDLPVWVAEAALPFAGLFGSLTRKTPFLTPMAVASVQQYKDVSHAKAAKELDYTPRAFRETLEDTFKWLKDGGYM